jgi:hypothetical protein
MTTILFRLVAFSASVDGGAGYCSGLINCFGTFCTFVWHGLVLRGRKVGYHVAGDHLGLQHLCLQVMYLLASVLRLTSVKTLTSVVGRIPTLKEVIYYAINSFKSVEMMQRTLEHSHPRRYFFMS